MNEQLKEAMKSEAFKKAIDHLNSLERSDNGENLKNSFDAAKLFPQGAGKQTISAGEPSEISKHKIKPRLTIEGQKILGYGLVPGKETSWGVLKKIFGADYDRVANFAIDSFLTKDPREKWNRFCVSLDAKGRFDSAKHFFYFELKRENKVSIPRVIFLGAGKPKGDVEVYCGYAAETLGYKFLGLGGERRRRQDAKNS